MVHRRHDQHRRCGPGALEGGYARRDRDRPRGRGRDRAAADVRRARRPGRPGPGGTARPGHRQGRRRGDLPADDAGGGGRDVRRGEHRGDGGPAVLRLRPGRDRLAAPGRGRQGGHHRRRDDAQAPYRAAEAAAGRGADGVPRGGVRRRGGQRRRGRHARARPRREVGRAAGGGPGPAWSSRPRRRTCCCSPTPPGRPAGRRARCTPMPASWSRWPARWRTASRWRPAGRSAGSPTWAGSWGRCRSSARMPAAAPCCSTKAPRTSRTPAGSGTSSSGTACRCSASRRRWSGRCGPPAARPAGDLSSVRVLGSTGEPWDPESYEWLARDVFGGRVPVVNFSGGTEVGGSFLCPYPVEEIRSCSLGGPALGMDVDVVDDDGRPLRGSVGELVCRQPWPSMTRGVWKDDERYREAYWSTYPGLWRHGDYALADEAGWFVLGRSDDVMNVAGKRVAPAEIESVLATDAAVAESAVVGIPDATKGEAVWAFWVRRPGTADADGDEDDGLVSARLTALVAAPGGQAVRACARGPRRTAAENQVGQDPAPGGPRRRARHRSRRSVRGREPRGRRGYPVPGQGAALMRWQLSEEQNAYRQSFGAWLADVAPREVVRRWLDGGDTGGVRRAAGPRRMGRGRRAGSPRRSGRRARRAGPHSRTARRRECSRPRPGSRPCSPYPRSAPRTGVAAFEGEHAALLSPADAIPGAGPRLTIDGEGRLHGTVPRVLAGDLAARFVAVADGPGGSPCLRLAPAGAGVRAQTRRMLDRSRPVADVAIEGAPSEPLDADAREFLAGCAARAAVLVAADSLGAMASKESDPSTLKHELVHALYALRWQYRLRCWFILVQLSTDLFNCFKSLLNEKYHWLVLSDELNAYLVENQFYPDKINNKKRFNKVKDKLIKLYETYSK